MKLRFCFAVANAFMMSLFAETGATTDGEGNLVVNVEEGESYSYDQAVVGFPKVIKTGTGLATFTVASSNYTGEVEVRAGVVDVTQIAFGKPCKKLTIAKDATYRHKGPGPTGQFEVLYTQLVIAGAGHDGGGCFRYMPNPVNQNCPDGTVASVMLTDDALLATDAKRWGVSATFKSNGHWLTTRSNNAQNFISSNATWDGTGGGGVIGDCTMECQSGHNFRLNGGNAAFIVNTNRTFTFYSWSGTIEWPFYFRNNAKLGCYSWSSSGGKWAGPIILDGSVSFNMDPYNRGMTAEPQHWYFSGPISGAGTLKLTGGANMWFLHSGNTADGGTDITGSCPVWADASGSIPGWNRAGGIRISNGSLRLAVGDNFRTDSDAPWTVGSLSQLLSNITVSNSKYPQVWTPKATTAVTYDSSAIGPFTHYGPGTLTFAESFDRTCSYIANYDGSVRFNGVDKTFPVTSLYSVSGVVEVAAGTVNTTTLQARGDRLGVVKVTGGTLTTVNDLHVGNQDNGGGALVLTDGSLLLDKALVLGTSTNSASVYLQTGGLLKAKSSTFNIGYGGFASALISGGTVDWHHTMNGQGSPINVGAGVSSGKGGEAVLTVTGSNTVVDAINLTVGNRNGALSTNIFNLSDGASFKARRFRKGFSNMAVAAGAPNPDPRPGWWLDGTDTTKQRNLYYPFTNAFAVANFSGGVLYPTFGYSWNGINVACDACNLDHVVLWDGGVTFDTSECRASGDESLATTGYTGSDFTQNLSDPTGLGIESIELPSALASFVYEAPPAVRIEGDGWGASAFAEWDPATKRVTGICVTSRGCDYTTATAVVDSPDRRTCQRAVCTLTDNAPHAGGVTKRGAQSLTLYGTNTYSGATRCLSGTLSINYARSVATNSWFVPAAGATINLPDSGSTNALRAIGGAGTIARGNVKVWGGVRQEAATLLANGKLTVSGNLTFGEGTTVSIDDVQALVDSGRGHWPLVTASSIVGTPVLDSALGPKFYLEADAKNLTLHYLQGTLIIFR